MEKFRFEMKIQGPTSLKLFKLDENTYRELEKSKDLAEDWKTKAGEFEQVASEVVMNVEKFWREADFSLVVKDEEDNLVFKTTNAEVLSVFNNLGCEESFEYGGKTDSDGHPVECNLPLYEYKGLPIGYYLAENEKLEYIKFNGEFETDRFIPSALMLFPSEELDCVICENDVFLSRIRYYYAPVKCEVEYHSAGSENKLKLLDNEDDWSGTHYSED